MKKRIASLLVLLMLAGVIVGLSSCSDAGLNPAPDIDSVYDRLVEVIEASYEVNVLLFGEGLPVYPRGDEEDELVHRYYGVVDNGQEYVTPYAKYATIAEMQAAVAKVYSTEYRESLFETTFTGYTDDTLHSVLPARYNEDDKFLYQNKNVKPLTGGTRVYDYASMKIENYSHSSYLKVSINSYTENDPGKWKTVYLTFVFENGNWYLDSPSC
jgi:hypothetical protein